MVLDYVPLVFMTVAWVAIAIAPLSPRVDRAIRRIALLIFGRYARSRTSFNREQVNSLRAAHIGTTYRVYASKTFLYASIAALSGSVIGAYGVVALYRFLRFAEEGFIETLPPRLAALVSGGPPQLALGELFLAFLASSATLGVLAAVLTYQFRWAIPSYQAGERGRRIDVSLERNVAFMYALSRSGMSFSEIFRILAQNREVYGETADEIAVAVKDIDLYGTDIIHAIERLARRTPSDDLEEFAENLATVMQSGRSLPSFLKAEYEYFSEEAEANQAQFLELLATLAEAYVTVLVAGPLFLITILVIIGLSGLGRTLTALQLNAYLVLPAATIGFVVYLDSITDPTAVGGAADHEKSHLTRFTDIETCRVGERGESRRRNQYRHRVVKRLRPLRRRLRNPLQALLQEPVLVFYVTAPIATLYLLWSWFSIFRTGSLELAMYDDALIHVTLFLLATFAVFHEVKHRRIRAIETNVPDFLDRLASTNEAGMPVIESFGQVVGSELGPLTGELERTWADIQWGAPVESALTRLRDRLRTPTITRVVALITNAMAASGDIGPVLRIAASEAKASRRLERDRRNEMVTYLVVIYLSFFVFLTIIVALQVIFIPQIPTDIAAGGIAGGGGAAGVPGTGATSVQPISKDAYSLVFFHTALVQGVCSGLVAGQMGENSIEAGAKHSFVMLSIAYSLFVLLA